MDRILEVNQLADKYKRKLICDLIATTLYESDKRIEYINRLYIFINTQINAEPGEQVDNIVIDNIDINVNHDIGEFDDSKSILTVKADPSAYSKLVDSLQFTTDDRDIIYQNELTNKFTQLKGKGKKAFIADIEKLLTSNNCIKTTNKKRICYTKVKFKSN